MTDQEINRLIARGESQLRGQFFRTQFDLRFLFNFQKGLQPFEQTKARELWNWAGRQHSFGPLSTPSQEVGNQIQKIYYLDPKGELLPLRQAIRLFDTFCRQQARLNIVTERLWQLNGLQETLLNKMARLQELGENYEQGARNLEQINDDYEALSGIAKQIQGSCARLEMLLISAEKAIQSRQLRRELNELSALMPRPTQAVEPAFEAESLETIERQIGREIETYLQLERETEEHLR